MRYNVNSASKIICKIYKFATILSSALIYDQTNYYNIVFDKDVSGLFIFPKDSYINNTLY